MMGGAGGVPSEARRCGGGTAMNGSSVEPAVSTGGRRAFLLGATAATFAVTSPRAFGQTAPSVSPPEGGKWYRNAGDLVADLAARRVTAVELPDQATAPVEAR